MENKNTAIESVHPEAEGFSDKITPKLPTEDLYFYKCAGCSGIHFRHAGYIELMIPLLRPRNEKTVIMSSEQVKVCVKCRKCYVWVNEQMYDVTEQVDLTAWEKSEVDLQKATGPGGEC